MTEKERKKRFGEITAKLSSSYGFLFKTSNELLKTWYSFFKVIPNFNLGVYEKAIDEFITNNDKPPSINAIANLYHKIASQKAAYMRKAIYCKICKGEGMVFFKPKSSDFPAAARCTCPAGERYKTLAIIPKYAIDKIMKSERNSA